MIARIYVRAMSPEPPSRMCFAGFGALSQRFSNVRDGVTKSRGLLFRYKVWGPWLDGPGF